jgi:hypothetical protein
MCDGVDVKENGAAFPTGEQVYRSSLRSNSVAVKAPSTTYANNLVGLCGAYSPPAFNNAFTNSCGDVTPGFTGGPAAGAKYEEFVRTFANTWRVDSAESLFGAGSDYACAPDPDPEATPQEETPPFAGCPEELRATAEKACAAAGMNAHDCIEDVGATCELDKWVQEAVDANVAANSAEVEKPNCTFLVTGRPKWYGIPKSFEWSGRCDTTFLVVSGPVVDEQFASEQSWCIRYFSIGSEFLMTSSGETLGYLSCSNQGWGIETKSTVISNIGAPADTPTASPTPVSESAVCKELAASTHSRKLQVVEKISAPSPLSMAQVTLLLPVAISGDASELHLDKSYMVLIHTLGQKLLGLSEGEAESLKVTPETPGRLESGRTRVVYAFVATVPAEGASSITPPTEIAINVLFTSALVLHNYDQYDIVPASGGVVESSLMISDAPQLLIATVTFSLPTAAPTTDAPTAIAPASVTTSESKSPAESTTQSSATRSTTKGATGTHVSTTDGAEGMAYITTSTDTEDAPVSKGHASFLCTAATLVCMWPLTFSFAI